MAKLKDIVEFLDSYLDVANIKDKSYNGLQFEGSEDVKKVMFAVDSGIEVFKRAVYEKADLLVVHHGIFWQGSNPNINETMKKRLKVLFDANISLYASHLPLDKHREAGNNAILAKIINGEIIDEFVEIDGNNIRYIARVDKRLDEIKSILDKNLNTDCKVLKFNDKIIKTVGICSGGAGLLGLKEAVKKGVDLYITGEQTDFFMDSKDNDINVIFAGHHATETTGVKALSSIISKNFDVDTTFVDIPTGL